MKNKKFPCSEREIIKKLSPHVTPERWQKIQRVVEQRHPHANILLEDIYDRGNMSAVMRSAEAFGIYQMDIIQTQEAFKESKRVTQGAHKWLLTTKWKNTLECVSALKARDHKIYVTHLDHRATPLEQVDFSQPFTIAFGNEKHGASEELLSFADKTVFIPMQGFVQSFNISVAAALCFYHIRRSSAPTPPPPDLQDRLCAHYLAESIDHWEKYLADSSQSR